MLVQAPSAGVRAAGRGGNGEDIVQPLSSRFAHAPDAGPGCAAAVRPCVVLEAATLACKCRGMIVGTGWPPHHFLCPFAPSTMNSRGSVGSSPLARRLPMTCFRSTTGMLVASTPIAATKTWSPPPSIWMTAGQSEWISRAPLPDRPRDGCTVGTRSAAPWICTFTRGPYGRNNEVGRERIGQSAHAETDFIGNKRRKFGLLELDPMVSFSLLGLQHPDGPGERSIAGRYERGGQSQ